MDATLHALNHQMAKIMGLPVDDEAVGVFYDRDGVMRLKPCGTSSPESCLDLSRAAG